MNRRLPAGCTRLITHSRTQLRLCYSRSICDSNKWERERRIDGAMAFLACFCFPASLPSCCLLYRESCCPLAPPLHNPTRPPMQKGTNVWLPPAVDVVVRIRIRCNRLHPTSASFHLLRRELREVRGASSAVTTPMTSGQSYGLVLLVYRMARSSPFMMCVCRELEDEREGERENRSTPKDTDACFS